MLKKLFRTSLVIIVVTGINTVKAQPSKFNSDYRQIYVTEYTETNANWDSLSGYGYTKLYNHNPVITVPVSFENIKLEYVSGETFLRRGTVNGYYKDTFNLSPLNDYVLTNKVYFDSLIIGLSGVAHVKCRFSPKHVLGNDTISFTVENWAKLESGDKILDAVYFNDTSIAAGNCIFDFSNSYIFIKNNGYRPHYSGAINYIYNDDTLKASLPHKISDISYFNASCSETIKFTNQINVFTNSCTFDFSETYSPGVFQDSTDWRGIYFRHLGIGEIKQDSTFIIDFNHNGSETVKGDSSAWLAYISNNKLTVDIDTSFSGTMYGEYNYFGFDYGHIKMNNLNDTLDFDIAGEVTIPYLKNKYFDITIPCKNNVIQLAETNANSAFQPFPLYECELKEFAFILEDGADTIPGKIDYSNKKIDIALPPLEDDYDYHHVYTNFSISGHTISLHYIDIISGEASISFDIYGDTTYELMIWSVTSKSQTYSLNIDVEEGATTVDRISNSEIKVYPNPITDYIEISGLNKDAVIQILDINGKQVIQEDVSGNLKRIDMGSLEAGVYFLQVKDNNGRSYQEKIIKL